MFECKACQWYAIVEEIDARVAACREVAGSFLLTQ